MKPAILAIIGISGDLGKRKLLPALRKIHAAKALPEKFRVIGVSRRDLNADDLLEPNDPLRPFFELYKMNLADDKAYVLFAQKLADAERELGEPADRVFYLSIPPSAVLPVIEKLGAAGLGERGKLLLEKPFGSDLASAEELVAGVNRHFPEEHVFRIDHYLAKEMARNLVVFRSENALFRHTWSSRFIDRVRIIASEKIGIEGRAAFYEQTGALRDFVQSHLLQLAALTVMRLPAQGWDEIPARRAEALESMRVMLDRGEFVAARGQYRGYREEARSPKSAVETFASLAIESSDPNWQGVPIELVTGKALDRKASEIRIYYRQEDVHEANELVLRLGSHEGVGIKLWAKKPGYEREVEARELDFSYATHYSELPEAYEQVFVDALRGDHSLFASGREVLASWRILEPLRVHWENSPEGLKIYEPGSKAEDIA